MVKDQSSDYQGNANPTADFDVQKFAEQFLGAIQKVTTTQAQPVTVPKAAIAAADAFADILTRLGRIPPT